MIDYVRYKTAPTWLYNSKGEKKLFQTQEEVDKAWDEGWFGPQDYKSDTKLISDLDFDTKQDLIDAVELDPRYEGLSLALRDTADDLRDRVIAFEEEHGLEE